MRRSGTGKFSRIWAIAAALALGVLTVAAVALADETVADGDGVGPITDSNLALGTIPCGIETSRDVPIAIKRNGAAGSTNVFKNGSTVVVSAHSVSGTGVSATVPGTPDNEITIPSTWSGLSNNTLTADTVTGTVKVTPADSGPGAGSVTFRARGVNSSNAFINRDDVVNLTWTAGSCDTTAPSSLASATNADASTYSFGDWTNQDVTITLSAQDNSGGSGVNQIRYTTDGPDPSASVGTIYSAPFTLSTEGTTTVRWRAIDNAGNLEAIQSGTVKIDKTKPSVTCASADADWHASDVSVACSASDVGGSGLADSTDATFNLVTSVSADSETSNASTDSRIVWDVAGNSQTAGPIAGNKVDKKAPALSCGSADGDWHGSDVSIACTASDGGSGLDPASDASFNLSTSVADGAETSDAQTATKPVSDAVGNTATAGPIGGNKIDRKDPSISCPTSAPTFTLGQLPATVTGTASDGGSGLASSATPSANADTSSVLGNPKSVSLAATDNVGNEGNQLCAYSVLYAFNGFFQPVDMNGVFNRAKAGSAIPVKFSLDGAPVAGSNTASDGGAGSAVIASAKSVKVTCPSGVAVETVEETVAASTSGLKYDPVADQWVYVWKTSTTLAGTCQRMEIALADGTTRTANFQFTK